MTRTVSGQVLTSKTLPAVQIEFDKPFKMKSANVLRQRLVNIVADAKRNELMIIYAEDMLGTGLTTADVNEGGSARGRWPARAGLAGRAVKGLKIRKR